MKLNFKRSMIFLILLITLILSINVVSASNDILDDSNYALSDLGVDVLDSQSNEINDDSAINLISTESTNNKEDSIKNTILKESSNEENSSLFSSSKLSSPIYVQHTGNDAKDLQYAINSSSNGDTIYLGDYNYNVGYNQINITKSISFKGNGETTTIQGYGYVEGYGNESETSVVYITAANVNVEGINFENIDPNLEYTDWDTLYGWALKVSAAARNVSIDSCSFINYNHGIYTLGDYLTVTNSYFNGTTTRLYTSYNTGGKERGTKCIHLDEADNAYIENNTFEGPVLDAILLEYGCANTQIFNNHFINNSYSIYIYGVSSSYNPAYGTVIANNTFYDCGHFEAPYFREYSAYYSFLPIIDAEDTILYDIIISENTFYLRNSTTIVQTIDDSSYIYGGVKVNNNVFKTVNDTINPSSIFLLVIPGSLSEDLDLDYPIVFLDNDYMEGMYVAFFEDYYADDYEYWPAYFGDLYVPASGAIETSISVSAPDSYAGDSTTVKIRLTDDDSNFIDSSVTLLIDDGENIESHMINLTNGQGSYVLNNLNEGTYDLAVAYSGDYDHFFSYNFDNFTVNRKETVLNLSLNKTEHIFADEHLNLTISLLDKESNIINGTVVVEVNNKTSNISVTNGIANLDLDLINILNNKSGFCDITVNYLGNDRYLESNNNLSFKVYTRNINLNIITLDDIVCGDTFDITITLTDLDNIPLNGTVKIYISDEKDPVNLIITEGTGVLTKSILEKGNYSIEVLFNDTEYGENYNFDDLEILGKNTTTSVTITPLEGILRNVEIVLKSNEKNLSGAVEIDIDDVLYKVIYVENGLSSFIIDDITENGNHRLRVKYYGDSLYASSENSTSFTIKYENDSYIKVNRTGNDVLDLQNAIDSANPGDIINLENNVFSDISNLNISKNVTIISDGATIVSAGDNNSIFNILESDIIVDISTLKFYVENNDTIVSLNKTNVSNVLFSITNNTVDLSSTKVDPTSVSLLYINSKLDDAFLNGIILKENTLISGMKIISLLEDSNNGTNGTNGTNPNETDPGNGTDNSTDNGTDSDTNKTVVKQLSKFVYGDMTTVAVDTVSDGRVGEYFVVKLTDVNGKALVDKFIQIGFNGNVYNRTTDENGSAKLQINLKNKGTYTFAICFLGDEEYNGSFVVSKITVNLQKPKLTTSSKTYKASATKTLTATFKSAKGNVVSGKTVSFTVNGKTYSAKTNSKGLASVKVSLTKKGTYSFTVKFAGDTLYSTISTSSKLTIK